MFWGGSSCLLQGASNSQPLWDRYGPAAPHYAAVSGFGAGWAGGLVSATVTVPGFFFLKYERYKRLNYTSCETGISIFKPVLGWVVLSLTFPWTGSFRNYLFWNGLQFFWHFKWTWTGKNFVRNQPRPWVVMLLRDIIMNKGGSSQLKEATL